MARGAGCAAPAAGGEPVRERAKAGAVPPAPWTRASPAGGAQLPPTGAAEWPWEAPPGPPDAAGSAPASPSRPRRQPLRNLPEARCPAQPEGGRTGVSRLGRWPPGQPLEWGERRSDKGGEISTGKLKKKQGFTKAFAEAGFELVILLPQPSELLGLQL
ncbi:uncharacterized protein ACH125_000516 [Urocitellus parryii]